MARGKHAQRAARRRERLRMEEQQRAAQEQEERAERLDAAHASKAAAMTDIAALLPTLAARQEKEHELRSLRLQVSETKEGNRSRRSAWKALRREMTQRVERSGGGSRIRVFAPAVHAIGLVLGEEMRTGYGAAGRDERFQVHGMKGKHTS